MITDLELLFNNFGVVEDMLSLPIQNEAKTLALNVSLARIVKLVEDRRVDVNKLCESGRYKGLAAIHICAKHGELANLMKFLIDHGADVNLQDANEGKTPLMFAIEGAGKKPSNSPKKNVVQSDE